MLRFISLIAFFSLSLLSFSLFAQKKGTGLTFDLPSYRGTPYKAKLTAMSYRGMPSSASVEQYAPTPGDQGNYGTCVAFAVAYHARTIMTAKLKNLTNKSDINKLIHSPTWVYESIKNKTDNTCQQGSNPVDALELLKNKGCAPLSALSYSCGGTITTKAKEAAADFVLEDYQILFLPDETDAEVRVSVTKKALAEGHPVILCFVVPESFYGAKTLWQPAATDAGASGKHGRHAMCIVGYDDTKFGGAFRVMNSWGTSWGDGGFVWIKYQDYATYALGALQGIPAPIYEPQPIDPPKPLVFNPEPTPNPQPKPEPKPQPKPEPKPQPKPQPNQNINLEGYVEFKKNTGEAMFATKILTRNLVVEDDVKVNPYKEDLVAYRMLEDYASGTRFRFLLTSNTESYIYAFATDLSGKVNKILPFADNMSPHIGANSQIAFPSETKVIKMDENKGTDYLLILFSAEKLDPSVMLDKMNGTKGGLSQKIAAALGDKLILPSQVQYKLDKIGFDVKGVVKGKVVPLMVEISHK
jgi:hypothetical protein